MKLIFINFLPDGEMQVEEVRSLITLDERLLASRQIYSVNQPGYLKPRVGLTHLLAANQTDISKTLTHIYYIIIY